LSQPRPGRPAYPPFYHYTLATVLSSDAPHRTVAWLNLGYLMALVLCAGWIAWELGGAWAAAAALLVTGSSPGLLSLYREAFPALAMAAWVCLAYALLLRSHLYQRPRWSWGVGLCAGLALDSRWSALVFLLPAWCAGRKEIRPAGTGGTSDTAGAGWSNAARRRNLRNATAVAAILALPWYLLNGLQMLPRIWVSMNLGRGQGLPTAGTLANWWYYPAFWIECFSWPGFLLLIGGAFCAIAWSRRDPPRLDLPILRTMSPPGLPPALLRAGRAWVAAWLIFSYVCISLVPTKTGRYILPAVAAMTSLGAAGLPIPALAAASGVALWHARKIATPQPGDWHEDDILREVSLRRDRSRPLSNLCLLANHRDINSDTYGWLLRHRGIPDVSVGCEQSDIPEWTDFVLAKSGSPGEFLSDRTLRLNQDALGGAELFSRAFGEAKRWPLPDGSEAVLFEARRDLAPIKGARRFSAMQIRSARLEDIRLAWQGGSAYEVSVATITLAKLAAPVRGVRLRLEGARLIEDAGRIYVLSLGTVTLAAAQLRWDELSRALSQRSRMPLSIGCEDGAVVARLGRGRAAIEAALRPSIDGDALDLRLERLLVLGVPLPGVRHVAWRRSLAPRKPYQPYALRLKPLRLDAQGLRFEDTLEDN
jgi:hypothetical protein